MAKATITMIDDNNNHLSIDYDIYAETKWEAIDYLMPCSKCGKIVLNSTVEITEDTHMCQTCIAEQINFEQITSKAEDKFWELVASMFPSITNGDLSISTTIRLRDAMQDAITEWYHTNTPAKDTTIPSPYKEFNELTLHFGKEWELEQTGGGVHVAYLMFYSKIDGEARRIGVSSECICIIDKPFEEGMVEDYALFFGDNPTAFLCALEEHIVHSDKFDFGKLFDDCQTIAKSGLV